MLVTILASFLLATPDGPATGSLQTAPQAAAESTITKLPHAEISDLQKRADSGDAIAQFTLGKAYESGNGVPQSPDQAAIWYRIAAEQGNARAQNSLGVLYWLGEGVEKDKTEAVRWYRKAARQGDASAMFNLGAAYYNGEGVGRNDTLAYAWFLLSSEAGDPSGQDAAKRSQGEHGQAALNDAWVAIGQMYEKGEDLPQNMDLASAWYRKAAEGGNTEAQVSLAILSMSVKNYNETRHWCEMAAKARHSGGYSCLGYLYRHGLGVEQNSQEAFNWYLQGARGSNLGAMRAVAQMYEKGEGTKIDRSEAFLWYFYAGRRRGKESLLEAQEVRSAMTEKEWKDTQKKLRQQGYKLNEVDEMLHSAGSQPVQ